VNVTLGGIDLNNSGRYVSHSCTPFLSSFLLGLCIRNTVLRALLICSVVVREDKKLLTVLFPDGRDGRAFTLKVLCISFST